MRLFRDHALPPDARGAVLAIGNFDGLHRGHRVVIDQAVAQARALGLPAGVLTFEPHPRRFFAQGKTPLRLIPFHHKARLLKAAGIDLLIAQRFNAAFAALSAEAFIAQALVAGIGARHIVTGEEFVFGRGRGGHAGLLAQAAQAGHFTYQAMTPLSAGQEKCSSTHIRAHVAKGEMDIAESLLGRPYHWLGRVIHGEARGRSMGYPTLNLLPPPVVLPRRGVYVVRCQRLGEAQSHDGVANFGIRPTFGGDAPLLEIHLLEQKIDWYGQRICVEFLAHLRDEQTFDGAAALRHQIQQDIEQATAMLAARPPLAPWHAALA